ncbi:hypothetical protein [Cellulophaga omnivescoria]|uniref:hypothetical protein n=1 Tax=Cellulophaga omnivescoria TaxID=1888890 RepID=UPI000987CE0B|nr:hypothetical protein [Cellulophaga omnivescoria]
MKILILSGIVAFIAFSVWYAKRNGTTAEYKSEPKKVLTEQDIPIDFGYKIVWIAVKTVNKSELSKILGLKNSKPSNWKSGIENAYENSVFITPQIGDWTLAVGMGLPLGDSQESIEKLEKILNELSSEFGEAQFFGTHRVVEYHNWMKSVNGKMERVYSYVGESMENIKVYGKPTEPESKLNLFNSLSEEAKSDEYYDREDLDYADEELVMKIAEYWSVNPTKLTERTDIKNELGIIGK